MRVGETERQLFPGQYCAMANGSGSNGDVLMLEAPPDPTRPSWVSASNAEIIDALPYIDEDYGHPAVKQEVDRLVEQEMRRSSKKPSDFLKDLPPLPKLTFEVNPSSSSFPGVLRVFLHPQSFFMRLFLVFS